MGPSLSALAFEEDDQPLAKALYRLQHCAHHPLLPIPLRLQRKDGDGNASPGQSRLEGVQKVAPIAFRLHVKEITKEKEVCAA